MTKKKFNSDNIIKRVKAGRRELKAASRELKKHFVGIDHIIDKIIKNIETWYIMPELLSRPVIICLFGPTGVGKTDLVRRLVKILNFRDRYCEIELMNKGGDHGWHSSISSILSSNPNIKSEAQSVILLDEIQNFRTIDENGNELSEYKFRDVWTLLSDGKLPYKVDLDYLLQMLWEYEEKEKKAKLEAKSSKKKKSTLTVPLAGVEMAMPHNSVQEMAKSLLRTDNDPLDNDPLDNEDNEDVLEPDEVISPSVPSKGLIDNLPIYDPDDDEDEEEDRTSYYTLKHFKNILRLKEPLGEIAKWTDAKRKVIITERLNDQALFEEEDYTKSLIFISGNLDEAYDFATKAEEIDVDADIYHDMSLKINILDIKRALGARFKPEQIARFGNMQVIYPSLNKATYETIIKRKVEAIKQNIKGTFGITLTVDQTMIDLIYNNGVFPTQGTRPVFSTISEVLESILPNFLLQTFLNRQKKFKIFYEKNAICAQTGDKISKIPYRGNVDTLKANRNKNPDSRILAAVHEAGHAVSYATLMNLAPPQLTALPASSEIGGFIWVHQICGAKKLLLDKIAIMLSGAEAEKLVFGDEGFTWGAKTDTYEATKSAGSMVKQLGMDHFSSYITNPQKGGDHLNTNIEDANKFIEDIMSQAKVKARATIEAHNSLFKDLIDALMSKPKVTPEEFKDICNKHEVTVNIKESEKIICLPYLKQYKAFKGKSG